MLAFVFLWRLCLFFGGAEGGIYIFQDMSGWFWIFPNKGIRRVSMASWQLVSLRYGWNWLKVPNQWHNWSYSVLTSPILVKELWIIYQLETTYILLEIRVEMEWLYNRDTSFMFEEWFWHTDRIRNHIQECLLIYQSANKNTKPHTSHLDEFKVLTSKVDWVKRDLFPCFRTKTNLHAQMY